MELRHLRYFVVVAEELHFGRAAQRLNMSQPPLSRQIQELEAEVGVPLFIRGYHKVELTPAGRMYLSHARRILSGIEEAKHEAAEVARGRRGRLRIGQGTHLPDGFLSRVLGELQRAAPHVAVELFEAPSPRVLAALRRKAVNAAFVMPPANTAGLAMKALLREPLVIALPEHHRYATAPLRDFAQLAHENFVLCRRYADSGYRELVEAACHEAGFTPRVLQSVERKDTVLELVAEGLGISVVQASVADPSLGVRYRPFPRAVPHVDTAIVWRDGADDEALSLLVEMAEREAARTAADRVVAIGAADGARAIPGRSRTRPGSPVK